MKPWVDSIIW